MGKHIVVIPGDGIGREVTDAAVEILKRQMKSIIWVSPMNGKMPAVRPMTSTACRCRRKQ